jgi:hypothetical protein
MICVQVTLIVQNREGQLLLVADQDPQSGDLLLPALQVE